MAKLKTTPCVGCGYCCIKVPCYVATRLYKSVEICPELYWDEKKKMNRCGLMRLTGDLGLAYRKELHAGAGCCASLNDWRKDVKKRTRDDIQYGYFNPLDKKFQMFLKIWASDWSTSGDNITLTVAQMKGAMEREGYGPDETDHTIKAIVHLLQENRQSLFKDFIG